MLHGRTNTYHGLTSDLLASSFQGMSVSCLTHQRCVHFFWDLILNFLPIVGKKREYMISQISVEGCGMGRCYCGIKTMCNKARNHQILCIRVYISSCWLKSSEVKACLSHAADTLYLFISQAGSLPEESQKHKHSTC